MLLIVLRVPFTNASSVPLACIQEGGPGSWPMWQKMLEISALRAAAPATPTRPSCTAPTAEQLDVANAVMEGRADMALVPGELAVELAAAVQAQQLRTYINH